MSQKASPSVKRGQAKRRSAKTSRGGEGSRALWNRDANDVLAAILKLESPRDARRFLRDLLTEDEIKMIASRWRGRQNARRGKFVPRDRGANRA